LWLPKRWHSAPSRLSHLCMPHACNFFARLALFACSIDYSSTRFNGRVMLMSNESPSPLSSGSPLDAGDQAASEAKAKEEKLLGRDGSLMPNYSLSMCMPYTSFPSRSFPSQRLACALACERACGQWPWLVSSQRVAEPCSAQSKHSHTH
jgi:hypothetical protein